MDNSYTLSSKYRDKLIKYHFKKSIKWNDRWYNGGTLFLSKYQCRDRYYYHEAIYNALKNNTTALSHAGHN
jgi:hypothetical protein